MSAWKTAYHSSNDVADRAQRTLQAVKSIHDRLDNLLQVLEDRRRVCLSAGPFAVTVDFGGLNARFHVPDALGDVGDGRFTAISPWSNAPMAPDAAPATDTRSPIAVPAIFRSDPSVLPSLSRFLTSLERLPIDFPADSESLSAAATAFIKLSIKVLQSCFRSSSCDFIRC